MTVRNRTDLKSFFVKNAIPTEGNFGDLIESQLNQAQDGVFKLENEPFSVVAAAGDQKRALRLYANYPAANPDWMISLNPAQDPANAASVRAGFGITDGAGRARFFVEAGTGRVGIGTNTPQAPLEVAGEVRANGFRGRNELVLNDYRTANPASNVCLHSPGGDRDAWIYRDASDQTSNWGIYHRQINSAVGSLPQNSIAFVGGGGSTLQAYVNLGDGSGFFAGKLNAGGYGVTNAVVNAATMEIGGPDPATTGARGGVLYLHDHSRIAHQLRYNNGTLYLEAAGNGYATNARPTLALGGDVSLEGKHALRGNDSWLRLNQDNAFTSGVHTPYTFTAGRIGAGTSSPGAALDVYGTSNVWGGWVEAIRFSRADHSAITFPKGNLLLGLHSDRNFYFADTAGGRYVMTISAASGDVNVGYGSLTVGADIKMTGGRILYSSGRMHIHGEEICYILNKNGLVVGKEWGGNGNLWVQGAKNFLIDHPLEKEKRSLVHTAIEGPEAAVFYRGEDSLVDGKCEIVLPAYFEALTRSEHRTVLVTPKLGDGSETSALGVSGVANGRFLVRAIDPRNPNQRFYWEVKAVRADIEAIEVEPLKTSLPRASPRPPGMR